MRIPWLLALLPAAASALEINAATRAEQLDRQGLTVNGEALAGREKRK